MVYRDPDTGKFRSGSGGSVQCDRWTAFNGGLNITIPAADLTGATQNAAVEGEACTVIDFGEGLDSDEVFIPTDFFLHTALAMPTTATAESTARLEFGFTHSDPNLSSVGSVHYGATAEEELGIADIRRRNEMNDDLLYRGVINAGNSFADSATGVGGGEDAAHDVMHIEAEDYDGFDDDDELYAPSQVFVQGADDHAVTVDFAVTVRGYVVDIDNC